MEAPLPLDETRPFLGLGEGWAGVIHPSGLCLPLATRDVTVVSSLAAGPDVPFTPTTTLPQSKERARADLTYTDLHCSELMGPLPTSNGDDLAGLVDEIVPGVAAESDDLVVGGKEPVGQPVVARELPDVFERVEFGGAGR